MVQLLSRVVIALSLVVCSRAEDVLMVRPLDRSNTMISARESIPYNIYTSAVLIAHPFLAAPSDANFTFGNGGPSHLGITGLSQTNASKRPTASDLGNFSAWVFDGVNDQLEVPDADQFTFNSGGGATDAPMSVVFWIWPPSIAAARAAGKTQIGRQEYEIYWYGGTRKLAFDLYGQAGAAYIERSVIIPTGQWSHVAYTYSGHGTTNDITVYVNGVQTNGPTGKSGTYKAMSNTTSYVTLGGAYGGFMPYRLRLFSLHNRVLESNEVLTLYQTQRKGAN